MCGDRGVALRRYGIACEPLPLRASEVFFIYAEIHATAAIRYLDTELKVSGFAEIQKSLNG